MKFHSLYLFLLSSVLLVFGCGGDAGEADAPAEAPPSESAAPPAEAGAPRILILGNSIAAGFGLNQDQAFPALLQEKIDSLGWDYQVVNAGVSGETSAGGLSRIGWLLREPIDVLVLELGGNDGLRGIPPEATRRNLQAIIDTTKARYPEARIVLAGMQIPPNLGQDYTTRFRDLFPALAEANDAVLIPFLLESVGGVPRLNLPDGIHPTAEGHEIVAENVWDVLRPVLAARQEAIADEDCALPELTASADEEVEDCLKE